MTTGQQYTNCLIDIVHQNTLLLQRETYITLLNLNAISACCH